MSDPRTAHGWTAHVIDNCGQPALVFDHRTTARVGSMWARDEREKALAENDLARCIRDAARLPGVEAERDALAAKLDEARALVDARQELAEARERADGLEASGWGWGRKQRERADAAEARIAKARAHIREADRNGEELFARDLLALLGDGSGG